MDIFVIADICIQEAQKCPIRYLVSGIPTVSSCHSDIKIRYIFLLFVPNLKYILQNCLFQFYIIYWQNWQKKKILSFCSLRGTSYYFRNWEWIIFFFRLTNYECLINNLNKSRQTCNCKMFQILLTYALAYNRKH